MLNFEFYYLSDNVNHDFWRDTEKNRPLPKLWKYFSIPDIFVPISILLDDLLHECEYLQQLTDLIESALVRL